jgi:hypothetical protein
MGRGFGLCWRRTLTCGHSVDRGLARRTRGMGFIVNDVELCGCSGLWVVRDVLLKRVARKLSGGQNSNFGSWAFAVCAVCCSYGSTNRGELGSVGKRWTVHVVQWAMWPQVYRSWGGQARSEDGRHSSF